MGVFHEFSNAVQDFAASVLAAIIESQKERNAPLGRDAEGTLWLFRAECGADGEAVLAMFNALNPKGVHLADPVNAAFYVPYARRVMKRWGALPHKGSLKHIAECVAGSFT